MISQREPFSFYNVSIEKTNKTTQYAIYLTGSFIRDLNRGGFIQAYSGLYDNKLT